MCEIAFSSSSSEKTPFNRIMQKSTKPNQLAYFSFEIQEIFRDFKSQNFFHSPMKFPNFTVKKYREIPRTTDVLPCFTTVPRYCTVFRVIFAGFLFQCCLNLSRKEINMNKYRKTLVRYLIRNVYRKKIFDCNFILFAVNRQQ